MPALALLPLGTVASQEWRRGVLQAELGALSPGCCRQNWMPCPQDEAASYVANAGDALQVSLDPVTAVPKASDILK